MRSILLRYIWSVLLLLCALNPGTAQDRSNPFEIVNRLPPPAATDSTTTEVATNYSPFDIRRAGTSAAGPLNPAPAASPLAGEDTQQRGPLVIQSADPNRGKGSVLAIQLILLITLASSWVLFGGLLRQCFQGMFNDSLMNQIYTRRSGGEVSALWLCYLFFFLVAGFYLYLTTRYFGVSINPSVWLSWLTYSLIVAGATGLKQLVVYIVGRLFPIRKEAGRYAFVLMVFAILCGVLLVPVNLGLSYAPPGARSLFLYGGAALLALVYLLHLARGLFITGSLATGRPLHLLLYICAVEIAPLLIIYRYLSSSLA